MIDILKRWLESEPWLHYDHCHNCTPAQIGTYFLTDMMLVLACGLLAAGMAYFLLHRGRLRLDWMFAMFLIFTLACGISDLLSMSLLWRPESWVIVLGRALSGATALAVAILLWPPMLRALRAPSNAELRQSVAQLEHEVAERKHAEQALRESQARLRELAAYQEKLKEDERKRIAREIHDELGQTLLALRLDVAMLHARTADQHPRLHDKAGVALRYIDTTMRSIRSIMNNLRPPVLDLGLHAAMEWQVNEFRRMSGTPCELVIDSAELKLDDAHATAVFRVLQESLTNIVRHARATSVRVELKVDAHKLHMAVRDNGIGMYPSDRRKAHRFGLVGMEERICALGGELRIDTVPGSGTGVYVTMPLAFQSQLARMSA